MENILNDLSGSEWLYWTGTVYPTNYPPDPTYVLRKAHGAMKPPGLMAEIISFFTHEGEKILDPFAGVGSTLIGAGMVHRQAVGFELNPRWVELYRRIQNEYSLGSEGPILGVEGLPIAAKMFHGDCLKLMKELRTEEFASIITDPPYGCQHKVGFKDETNFSMFNRNEAADIGNAPDFPTFLIRMEEFGREALRVLKPGRYLILLLGDRFIQGEYVPLAVHVAEVMRKIGFKWKGIRLWWNQATQRPLRPYAVKRCFIPNIQHQTLVILRKD
jgi:DNA modification methylase